LAIAPTATIVQIRAGEIGQFGAAKPRKLGIYVTTKAVLLAIVLNAVKGYARWKVLAIPLRLAYFQPRKHDQSV
jgi:hypothetical protein